MSTQDEAKDAKTPEEVVAFLNKVLGFDVTNRYPACTSQDLEKARRWIAAGGTCGSAALNLRDDNSRRLAQRSHGFQNLTVAQALGLPADELTPQPADDAAVDWLLTQGRELLLAQPETCGCDRTALHDCVCPHCHYRWVDARAGGWNG